MNATVAQLTARSLLGRRRVLALAILPLILLVLSVVIRSVAGDDLTVTVALLSGFALGTVVPLLALVAGTGAIGPEIDDGSVVYLLAKPLPRPTIVTSKLAVAIGVVTVVAAVPTLLAGVVVAGLEDGLAVAFGVGAVAAGIAYCALFLLLAVVSRNAVVIGLLYALIWESLIGGFVPGAQVLSVQQWGLAVTEGLLGGRAEALGVTSAVSTGTGIALLVVVTVGATAYAGQRLRSLRVGSGES
ncbi:ABC transporter permease subunit [Euzebya sp.]|uniref:ABC transporter permease subunit n=1 Tax=Euzebya sp. TaxID=1971409 RepID=UPI003512BD58